MKDSKTMVTIIGEITEIGKLQTFPNSKFRKMQFVVRTGEQSEKYPNFYPLVLKNEDVAKIEGWKVGDIVQVSGFVNGNRWQKKDGNGNIERTAYFLEIVVKSIGEVTEGEAEPSEAEEPAVDDMDDIPF
jgi:hypothetical protein